MAVVEAQSWPMTSHFLFHWQKDKKAPSHGERYTYLLWTYTAAGSDLLEKKSALSPWTGPSLLATQQWVLIFAITNTHAQTQGQYVVLKDTLYTLNLCRGQEIGKCEKRICQKDLCHSPLRSTQTYHVSVTFFCLTYVWKAHEQHSARRRQLTPLTLNKKRNPIFPHSHT